MSENRVSPLVKSVGYGDDREHIKALAAASALEMPGNCEHCGGSGCGHTTALQVVHCFAPGPAWFGEVWDLPRLHAAIDSADHIRWVNDPAGHDLVVTLDGEHYRFAVKRPALVKDAGSAA